MAERYVEVTRSAEPVQRSLVEEALEEAGIPFETMEGHSPSAILGFANPVVDLIYRVPEDKLQAAKDALCARGIVCDISARLLRRTFEEVVQPLLGQPAPDLGRLAYLVGINNKETVRALFALTLEAEGGLALLEALFFALAPEDVSALRALARVIAGRRSAAFTERFLAEVRSGPKPVRLGLLEVISELPLAFPREEALAAALRDEDPEVRDAASEALFATKRTDYGYDPEAPAAEREKAIERFLRASRMA
ncbi:MAG: hypothetical protein HY721_21855 [Planctomycetes bacterium]|nr:hypothetical protein [Planctomycetota bacterium]